MKKMPVLLWIIQGLLAALFLFSGVMKLITPMQQLQQQAHLSGLFMKFIGVLETLGALGLILPGLLRIRQGLTPLAALGLFLLMIGATIVTLVQGAGALTAIPVVVGLLCAFVAYGRRRVEPAAPAMPAVD